LFMLAAEVPAAILAKMLGIHIKAAVQWQQLSNGDWTTCRRTGVRPQVGTDERGQVRRRWLGRRWR
ncbi:hypothetical protein ABNF97_34065, partial [Plantactinospora sp. B6F1]|uniref:hypothetical protein n=1 Tax=Plantactinospora sp. B6F1 TaxID=3158971 RepID=UPI0032D93C1B